MNTLVPPVMETHYQAPEAFLAYGWDWSTFLEDGETITASVWTTTAGQAVLSGATNVDGVTRVNVTGGTLGGYAEVANQITTSAGRKQVMTKRVKFTKT